MNAFRKLIAADVPAVAPLVFNPLTAMLAQAAGFRALYLGGGAMGYLKGVTEANLSLTEMVQAGIDIRTVCPLPLILDGACGFGDPMHMHRTIQMTEAAGFCAIEIEDQILPKRAHHHIGIEHNIAQDEMVAKIAEAVAARRDADFVIIGRTNAARSTGLDDALRRAEAYRAAGADMALVLPKTPDQIATIGERLGAPLMLLTMRGGLAALGMTPSELGKLGYRLIVDASTPLLVAYKALRQSYGAMFEGVPDPMLGVAEMPDLQDALHQTIGLEALLAVERRTVERAPSPAR